jgi:P4 family phage/plasmid primase-like protien
MNAKEWFERGFTDIISVIPPDGKIANHSALVPSERGKVPAEPFGKDEWVGLHDFNNHVTTPFDIDRWMERGANIGLRARYYPGVDIDVDHLDLASRIRDQVREALGYAPIRVGREPRMLLPYRTEEPFTKKVLQFYYYAEEQKIEVLGSGQQYVVYGQHPTHGAYKWRTPEPSSPAELSLVTEEQIVQMLFSLGEWLETQPGVERVRLTGKLGNTSLEADLSDLITIKKDQLREAMALIPNDEVSFRNRESVIMLAHALYGATYDDPIVGRELFIDFMARSWHPKAAEADWGSTYDSLGHPRIGAEVIFRRAARYGFDLSSALFSPVEIIDTPPPALPSVCQKYTDSWATHRFLEEYGDLIRYVPAWREFIVREENLWMLDKWCRVKDDIRQFCEGLGPEIIADLGVDDGQNVVARFQSDRNMTALERMLTRHRSLMVQPEEFDANPHVLNTPAGLFDLRSGKELPIDHSQINLRQTSVVPDWDCPIPLFSEFISFVTNDDPEMIDLLQRLAGYALTGNSTEQIFFFAYGTGGNGKGMFIRLLQSVLGDYAATVNSKVFLKRGREPHLAELLPFQGRRLIAAQEFESDAIWDESRIKLLTGDDRIVVEKKHGDPFEFAPTHTLLLAGNSIPHVPDLDAGIRRRMRLLPFTRVVPEDLVKENREEQIRVNELPGVLAWLIDGAKIWYQRGLGEMPESVLLETENYFMETDDIQLWIDECCEEGKDYKTSSRDLYESLQLFLLQRGSTSLSQRAFSMRLQRRGYKAYRSSTQRGFEGLRLRESATPALRMLA